MVIITVNDDNNSNNYYCDTSQLEAQLDTIETNIHTVTTSSSSSSSSSKSQSSLLSLISSSCTTTQMLRIEFVMNATTEDDNNTVNNNSSRSSSSNKYPNIPKEGLLTSINRIFQTLLDIHESIQLVSIDYKERMKSFIPFSTMEGFQQYCRTFDHMIQRNDDSTLHIATALFDIEWDTSSIRLGDIVTNENLNNVIRDHHASMTVHKMAIGSVTPLGHIYLIPSKNLNMIEYNQCYNNKLKELIRDHTNNNNNNNKYKNVQMDETKDIVELVRRTQTMTLIENDIKETFEIYLIEVRCLREYRNPILALLTDCNKILHKKEYGYFVIHAVARETPRAYARIVQEHYKLQQTINNNNHQSTATSTGTTITASKNNNTNNNNTALDTLNPVSLNQTATSNCSPRQQCIRNVIGRYTWRIDVSSSSSSSTTAKVKLNVRYINLIHAIQEVWNILLVHDPTLVIYNLYESNYTDNDNDNDEEDDQDDICPFLDDPNCLNENIQRCLDAENVHSYSPPQTTTTLPKVEHLSNFFMNAKPLDGIRYITVRMGHTISTEELVHATKAIFTAPNNHKRIGFWYHTLQDCTHTTEIGYLLGSHRYMSIDKIQNELQLRVQEYKETIRISCRWHIINIPYRNITLNKNQKIRAIHIELNIDEYQYKNDIYEILQAIIRPIPSSSATSQLPLTSTVAADDDTVIHTNCHKSGTSNNNPTSTEDKRFSFAMVLCGMQMHFVPKLTSKSSQTMIDRYKIHLLRQARFLEDIKHIYLHDIVPGVLFDPIIITKTTASSGDKCTSTKSVRDLILNIPITDTGVLHDNYKIHNKLFISCDYLDENKCTTIVLVYYKCYSNEVHQRCKNLLAYLRYTNEYRYYNTITKCFTNRAQLIADTMIWDETQQDVIIASTTTNTAKPKSQLNVNKKNNKNESRQDVTTNTTVQQKSE